MARKAPYEVIAGSTLKMTWVNSGVTPGSISSALRDRNDTLINSMAAVDSGNGHFYAIQPHPSSYSGQWVVNEWIAIINANTYVERQFGRIIGMEAD